MRSPSLFAGVSAGALGFLLIAHAEIQAGPFWRCRAPYGGVYVGAKGRFTLVTRRHRVGEKYC
jgi:hypothetical protein